MDRTSAADLWRNTLSRIPSVYGRLVYLAGIRDANTGRYQHFGLVQRFNEEEAHRVLRQSHETAWAEWLCLSMEEQKADLDFYLSGMEADRKTIVENWLRLSPYRNLPPASATPAERQLFQTDIQALLEVLRTRLGVTDVD